MSELTKAITDIGVTLADLKISINMLEKERDILAEQNVDLKHKIKRMRHAQQLGH